MNFPKQLNQPELLAPAGNIESFFAGLGHGADAIYVGCRHHNARALATNFNLEEIARLKEYARGQGVKLYVALNAIAREEELGELVHILASLAKIEPDGLIIQDGAIARLCRLYFPNLDLHASTLMTVHNSAGVEQLEAMGFQRAVLARELTLDEIAQISASTGLELEIFIHGALCFSYSGLCLASSFYGGRSSLRGRCVQPCRRLYRSGRQQGYFFSTNDLSAIGLIPALRQLGIAALKIEGRMKPASYVAAAVRAYRLVLDASKSDETEAIVEARGILREAYGRKPTQGFLVANQQRELITPHRSGASGRLAARIDWVRGNRMALRVRSKLVEGDRVRLDSDEGVGKTAFKIRKMFVNGRQLGQAVAGTVVTVARIEDARTGDRVFKTSSKPGKKSSAAKLRRILMENTSKPTLFGSSTNLEKRILGKPTKRKADKQPTTLYLRFSDLRLLSGAFGSGAHWILLQTTKVNMHSLQRRKLPPSKKDRIFLALPPIIHDRDLPFYRDQIKRLQQKGYNRWLVANWGHFPLFGSPPESLIADYTFNVINSQASSLLKELGCQHLILSLENDRDNLRKLASAVRGLTPLITVYGWPPLLTSRLQISFRKGSRIRISGREHLRFTREEGLTPIRSTLPLCLFGYLQELRKIGVRDFVLDLRGQTLRHSDLPAIMKAVERQRCPQPHSTFNYLRRLV